MASCARRFGRNPYEHGRKSASKMGLSTSLRTACTTRSVTVESPAWGQFPARLGNLDLTYLDRLERPRPQLLTHAQQELLDPDPGGDPGHRGPVHPRGPRPRVPRDALPRHHQERRVTDQVVQIVEPATGVPGRPPMQLGLRPPYRRLRPILLGPDAGAGIHRRVFGHHSPSLPPLAAVLPRV